jgi:hypothetical protein
LTVIPLQQRGFGETMRRDAWWGQPLLTLVVLGGFVVYATWAALQGDHYEYGPYLSPFYSPLLFGEGPHSWFGPVARPGWWPGALPFSAAMLILWAPGGFRFTCYYYRGAYYKAFWADPPSCAVGEPRKSYRGENSFPLILQNVHRYFWYAAVLVGLVLTFDTVLAFRNAEHEWGHMGLGTLLMLINVTFIWLYTLSCHSCRHAVGGRLRHFSKHPVRYKLWGWVSTLNGNHARYAWLSLFSIWAVDLYVWGLAAGWWTDPRFF